MRRVAGHHDLMLRGEQRPRAEDLTGGAGVGRGDQVQVGACGTGARQGKRLGGQGGENPVPGGIEPVQVVRHLGVRPFVPGLGLRVAGTDAEQEPVTETASGSGGTPAPLSRPARSTYG